jgi:hypothetical protein
MQDKDDEKARASRADRLHERIHEIKTGRQDIPPGSPKQPDESENDFVERRMREIEEKEKGQ